MAYTTCGSSCKRVFDGAMTRRKCREVRKCACEVCAGLKGINLQLHKACVDECQTNQQHSKNEHDFICQQVGADSAFNNYRIRCGKLEDLTQFKVKKYKDSNKSDYKDYYIVGVCIIIFLILKLKLK